MNVIQFMLDLKSVPMTATSILGSGVKWDRLALSPAKLFLPFTR